MEINNTGRILWLTDTYGDHNGVSMVLKLIHREIQSRGLPVDILVCSDTIQPEDHLLVVKPMVEFSFPFYKQQRIRIPGLLALRRVFLNGNYNKIICSTEGPMGFASIYLRKSFGIKSFFYLHTDWLTFAKTALKMGDPGLTRVARLLRLYYNFYDGLFVLNTEQKEWLTGESMRQKESKVFLTAHWADPIFQPRPISKMSVFGLPEDTPVLLYAGRISEEKGVMELPEIYRQSEKRIPGLKMVVAGSGPALEKVKETLPDAHYTGWINHDRLPDIYSAADLLVLPSRFDTFSCVVLEALSCGLPVIAYNTKGPKDIIQHGANGFLAEDLENMCDYISDYFADPIKFSSMREDAVERGRTYNVSSILDQFMKNVGVTDLIAENGGGERF